MAIVKSKKAVGRNGAASGLATPSGIIELRKLKDHVLTVPIVGLTPVIPHRWSEKSKQMMPGHPMQETVAAKKGVREPEIEAEACLYKMGKIHDKKGEEIGDRLGMPATAFKAALVGACRFFDKPSMVECKLLVFVEGVGSDQLVPIEYVEKELHEDTPRNSNGSADLRYRYYLCGWSAKLRIRFVPTSITANSIVTLVDAAGRGGVGDWRPSAPKSSTGTYGCWRVSESGIEIDENPPLLSFPTRAAEEEDTE